MVSWKGGEPGYIPIIVYGPGDVKIGLPGDSHQQLGSISEYAKSELRAYYNPQSNYLQITSHGPENLPADGLGWLYDGMLEYGFNVSMEKTRVNFLGYYETKRLGEVFNNLGNRDADYYERRIEPPFPYASRRVQRHTRSLK